MPGNRFMRRGVAKIYFETTLVDPTAPTLGEITGAEELAPDIAEIGGLTFRNEPIPTPDLENVFETSIPGGDTAEAPVLTFYEREDTAANQTLANALAKGTEGYLIVAPDGLVTGYPLEVWPVTSTGVPREYSAGNDPARFSVTFAVTAVPTLDATVPA